MNKPIVRDFGHFDSAIDLACLENSGAMKVDTSRFATGYSCRLQAYRNDVYPLPENFEKKVEFVARVGELRSVGFAQHKKSTLCAHQMAVPGQRQPENPR